MITTFVLALLASFWGSVPPAPSNLAVMHTVLNKNTRTGLWLALGACIPELPYSFLALLALQYVSAFKSVEYVFEIAAAIILFVMGTYATFFQAKKKVDLEATSKAEGFNIPPFWKGMLIGSLNPMIFAFWLVTAGIASKAGWLNVNLLSHRVGFILGTAVGALLLLCVVAFFTRKIKERLTPTVISHLNKAIGIAYLVLALFEAVRSFLHYF